MDTDPIVGVVAHVDRQEQIDRLSSQISPELIEVDDGSLGAGGNHLATLRALRAKDPHAWVVVMEDDALPVENFRSQLTTALSVAPTPVVSFYCGTGYPAQYQSLFAEATQTDACWLLHPQMRHGVCYALDPSVSKPVLIRMEQLVARRYAPDDAISRWCMEQRIDVAYSNPSLVDHQDGPTVVDYRYHLGQITPAGRKRPRKAYKVGTRSFWVDTSVRVKP